MEGAALQRREAFGGELGAAVDQARLLGAVLERPARDVVVVGLVGLAEVGGVGVRAPLPCRASSAGRRWCRGRPRRRCRRARRREGAGGWWPWVFACFEDAIAAEGRYFQPRTPSRNSPPGRGWLRAGACGKLAVPPGPWPRRHRSMSTHPPTLSKPSVPSSGTDHDALPPGTRFGEFEILRVLGVGGFGIVYLAQDHSLEREVALKEYMPASLAARGAGPQITVRSSSFAETYAIGLRSFINEARLLARFDHPSLVKVYRFWEDNATAYMVMPFLQGMTLRDARRGMPHAPDEAWIRSVLTPILSALELLHREGVYHRDIAPDNILLPRDGPPVLLDFGAARRVISDRTQSLTAILKPSYAPIEQYAEMTQLRQGPWTDIYALGAVVHYLLFGVPPAPATGARRPGRRRCDREPHRPGRVAALPRGDVVDAGDPAEPAAAERRAAARGARRPRRDPAARPTGATVPGALAPSTGPQIEQVADATRINTAYLPTHLPTARVAPASDQRATTTFSPKAPMPTARQTPIEAPPQRPAGPPVPTATPPAATANPQPARPAPAQPPATTSQRPAPQGRPAAAGRGAGRPLRRDAAAGRCAGAAVAARAQVGTRAAGRDSGPRSSRARQPSRQAPRRAAASPRRSVAKGRLPARVPAASRGPHRSRHRSRIETGRPRSRHRGRRRGLRRFRPAPRGRTAGRRSPCRPHRGRLPSRLRKPCSGTQRRGAVEVMARPRRRRLVRRRRGARGLAVLRTSRRSRRRASHRRVGAGVERRRGAGRPRARSRSSSSRPILLRRRASPRTPTKSPLPTPDPPSPPPPTADTTARAPTADRAPIPDAGAASGARVRPPGKPVPRVGEDPALAANSGNRHDASARVADHRVAERERQRRSPRGAEHAAAARLAAPRSGRRHRPNMAANRFAMSARARSSSATSAWTSDARRRASARRRSASRS